MQSLLRWSIEHSTPSDGSSATPAPQPRSDLDPAIIDHILGRPDAELMKENLAVALDEQRELHDRVQALDNFEMLIESIDNANDLEKLEMWEPLHTLLTSSTSEDEIKRLVLWILGTAVQNNPSAQTSYLKRNPIPALLAFLQPSSPTSNPSPTSPQTRAKAVYALSSLLKHNASAVRQLSSTPGGWAVLKAALGDSDMGVRRKVAFLIGSLLMPGSEEEEQEQEQELGSQARQQQQGGSTLTSTALVPSTTTSPPPPSTNTHLHTPNTSTAPAPVYPNSHASMLASPSFFSTSALTRKALEENGMLETLVESVVCPVPFGEDGEFGLGLGGEGDEEFEGKVIGTLNTYLVSLRAPLPPSSSSELQTKLAKFVRKRLDQAGGDPAVLAEKWGLGEEDVVALGQVLGV